jgi:nucleotide-binding universal stress UspA family protein
MNRHILVPLDGSQHAAAALPYALTLARATDTYIRLLSVVAAPFPHAGFPSATANAGDRRHIEASTAYLESVAGTMRTHGLAVTTVVRHGNPADEILAASEDEECALIAMSTHGRTGLERLRIGSVAHHVARHAEIPTLVVRPRDGAATEGAATITGIIAMLDGSDFAETALAPATRIATALAIPLTLLQIIPNASFTASQWDGGWSGWYPETDEMEHDEERSVAEYLEAIAAHLRAPNLEVRTGWQRSVTNRAAGVIAAVLAEEPAGLAVMASHGRGGVLRWALGSTAEETLDSVRCPILIIRAGTAAAEAGTPAQGADVAMAVSGERSR